MTIHTDDSDSARHPLHLAWARQTLGLGEDDSLARRKFLERLEAEELVPPEDLVQAWQTFQEQSQGLFYLGEPAGFLRQDAEVLERDVDVFAKEFFQFETQGRIARYGSLFDRTLHAVKARARLTLLARALKVDAAGLLQGRLELQQELGRWLCELFVLSPLDRGARRAEMLREVDEHRAAWRLAARQLKKQLPAMAALDQALLAQIIMPNDMPPLEHYQELRESGYLPGVVSTVRQVVSGAYFRNAPPAPVVRVRSAGNYADLFHDRVGRNFPWIFVACIAIAVLAVIRAPSSIRVPRNNFPTSPGGYPPFRLPPSGFPSSDDIDEAMRRLREEKEWLLKERKKNEEEERIGFPPLNEAAPLPQVSPPKAEKTPKTLEEFFESLPQPSSRKGLPPPLNERP